MAGSEGILLFEGMGMTMATPVLGPKNKGILYLQLMFDTN
jgi:hypothetical protein